MEYAKTTHDQKPKWVQMLRIVQGAETPMLKEKFINWRELLPRNVDYSTSESLLPRADGHAHALQQEVDVSQLLLPSATPPQPDKGFLHDGTGTLKVWRIDEFKKVDVPEAAHGVFFEEECYLLMYMEVKDKKRCHYIYFWQGRHSPMEFKGASALMAKEMADTVRGKCMQYRITQGKEPEHFLMLFKSKKPAAISGQNKIRDCVYPVVVGQGLHRGREAYAGLYHVKQTFLDEAFEWNTKVVQVPTVVSSLNSNDAFVLLGKDGKCFVWCGAGCSPAERRVARAVAQRLVGDANVGRILTVDEGKEPAYIWAYLEGGDGLEKVRSLYPSANYLKRTSLAVRLFVCSNTTGTFKVQEISNFTQDDLDNDDVFMLDCFAEVFLWVGAGANETEKKMSMQTALNYVAQGAEKAVRPVDTPIYYVEAGKEPPQFTCHFLAWDSSLLAPSQNPEIEDYIKTKPKPLLSSRSTPTTPRETTTPRVPTLSTISPRASNANPSSATPSNANPIPRATSPRPINPTTPRATSPRATSPRASSPRATSPRATSPRATSPRTTSPRPIANPTTPRASATDIVNSVPATQTTTDTPSRDSSETIGVDKDSSGIVEKQDTKFFTVFGKKYPVEEKKLVSEVSEVKHVQEEVPSGDVAVKKESEEVKAVQGPEASKPSVEEAEKRDTSKTEHVEVVVSNSNDVPTGHIDVKEKELVQKSLVSAGTEVVEQSVIIQLSQAEESSSASATAGPRRLYVSSLHFNITEEDLQAIFTPFGDVEFIDLPMDPETNRSKGSGFVQFRKAEDAKVALQVNAMEIAGLQVKVELANENSAVVGSSSGGDLAFDVQSRATDPVEGTEVKGSGSVEYTKERELHADQSFESTIVSDEKIQVSANNSTSPVGNNAAPIIQNASPTNSESSSSTSKRWVPNTLKIIVPSSDNNTSTSSVPISSTPGKVVLTKKDGSVMKVDPTKPKKFTVFAKRAGVPTFFTAASEAASKVGTIKAEVKVELVKNELEKYNKQFYTFEELTAKKKPPGVDVTMLEKYLTDEDFKVRLEMTKAAFYALPPWKRLSLRKKALLY